MIKLYTIGFTQKSAQTFFELLEQNHVKRIIDIRLNNRSQLAGFAKGKDLAFFAQRIANIAYVHRLDLAPTQELLRSYRNKEISWEDYTQIYLELLETRNIKDTLDFTTLDSACLLCSEPTAEQCHRRLLAEYLQSLNPDIQIVHLQ